jgi:hypothetical protein
MNQELELIIPDFAILYRKAIKALKTHGLVSFTDLEAVIVGHITSLETERIDGIADRIVYEIDDLHIPKYVCLMLWLSPFGIASHRPKLILRLAKFLLGYTTEQEIKNLPQKLRADLGV